MDFSPVSPSIATSGWLDLSLTELLTKVLRRGMVVVDVGANIGYYTLLFAKIVGDNGVVYAVEPEPLNFQLLNKSIKVNNLTNVRIRNQALSEASGTLPFHLSDPQSPQAHSLSRDWGMGTIQVSSTTLDMLWESLGRPHIDLVKIHVGDDDVRVLRGSRNLIGDDRPPMITMIFIKSKWNDSAAFLENILHRYELYQIVHSPFLIRRVDDVRLLGEGPVEIFLVPKKISKDSESRSFHPLCS